MTVSKIWVFAEADGDKPSGTTLELLTKARELADAVEAVHVGNGAAALAASLGEHGATKVFAVDPGDALPGVVGAATLARSSRALLRRRAVRAELRRPRCECPPVGEGRPSGAHQRHRFRADGDKLVVGTATSAGTRSSTPSSKATDRTRGDPSEAFAAEPAGGAAEVVSVPAGRRCAGEAKVLEHFVEERGAEARRGSGGVSGGRGIGSAEGWPPSTLAAARWGIGRSRRSSTPGAVPKQVGQTGKVVAEAYIASASRAPPSTWWHEGLRQHHRGEQGWRGADLRPISASWATHKVARSSSPPSKPSSACPPGNCVPSALSVHLERNGELGQTKSRTVAQPPSSVGAPRGRRAMAPGWPSAMANPSAAWVRSSMSLTSSPMASTKGRSRAGRSSEHTRPLRESGGA